MKRRTVRALCVAALLALMLFPLVTSRMSAPANYGAHGLTTGFGRGRLDVAGIVSEGSGGRIELPPERATLSLRLSGNGPIRLRGEGVERTVLGSDAPGVVSLDLPRGGIVSIESDARIRLLAMEIERTSSIPLGLWLVVLAGVIAIALSWSSFIGAIGGTALLSVTFFFVTRGTLSATFATLTLAQLCPLLTIVLLFAPLVLALRYGLFLTRDDFSRLSVGAFIASLALTTTQLAMFDQPLPMGDPAAYFEMGEKYAAAAADLRSPLDLGPALSGIQPYLALPATGILYGTLRWIGGGLTLIYAVQALAMAFAASLLVAICEKKISLRAARIALFIALVHPTFSIAPGIVQPESFIMAAWLMAALMVMRASDSVSEPRTLLGAGVFMGIGLSLHPQGLSFLLLALLLCLLPWAASFVKRPALIAIPLAGAFTVLLPVAAAEHFSKPLAYVLDKQYGFFAYTSPHPLGFWLYTDSDGWQGPLRIEETTYQRELIAEKGESAVSSTFGDVAAFVARHPARSLQTVMTNLHRLWNQPDNPFAVPFVLPHAAQIPLHRGLIVLFVLSLPALLSSRRAVLALPFVMLSMTYPAYHVFNKYATPALPFVIIGAALAIDRIIEQHARTRSTIVGLAVAATGALLPAGGFASLGIPGDLFVLLARGLLWTGLAIALWQAIPLWSEDARARGLATAIGLTVLIGSSVSASFTDADRTAWSVPTSTPVEATCPLDGSGPAHKMSQAAPDPAWLLLDVQSSDGKAPRVEINGLELAAATTTMPPFGLATFRGHRDPETFRQIWRTAVPEELLATASLQIRVTGGDGTRLFGDIRRGNGGPRLSLGNWPHLSVYRLMHEGQYRLPVFDMPVQECSIPNASGRPGIFLARIPAGAEAGMALRDAQPVDWLF